MGISMGNTYFHVFDRYSSVSLHKIVCLLTFLLVSNNFNIKNVNKQVQKCKQIHILLKIVQMNGKEIFKKIKKNYLAHDGFEPANLDLPQEKYFMSVKVK